MGAGRGTSVGSKCSVSSKCNIKKKNPAHKRVHKIGIGVQGEGSNVNLVKEWREGTHESRGLGSV